MAIIRNQFKPVWLMSLALTASIFLVGSFSSSVFAQAAYIKKYKPLAKTLSKQYGIPSAVILGIAVVESSSGKSRTCRLLHNHFGIVGKNNLRKTKGIKTRYKQYPNDKASYIDFCVKMSKKKFYPGVKGKDDVELWLINIANSGYSEKPEIWKARVLKVIKENNIN